MAQGPGWYVRSTKSTDAYYWDGEKFTGQSQEVFAGEPYSIFPEDELLALGAQQQLTIPSDKILLIAEEKKTTPLKGPVLALLVGFGVFALIVASLAIIPKMIHPPSSEPLAANPTLKSTTIPIPEDYNEKSYEVVDKDAQFIEDVKRNYPKWTELPGWNEKHLIVGAKRICEDTRDGIPLTNQKILSDLLEDDIPEVVPFTKVATIAAVRTYCPSYTEEAVAVFSAN